MPDGRPDFDKDLVAHALGLILERYKNKRILQALVTSYVSETQEIRDAIQEVALARDMRTAFGIYLDVVGKIVQAARNSANDEAYRLIINTKIAQNKSFGRAGDFETVWNLMGNDPTDLRIVENFPASATISSPVPVQNAFLTNSEMLDVLTRIFRGKMQAAGVRLSFVFTTDPNTFKYKNLGAFDVPTAGYSDANHPTSLLYGKYSSVI